MSRKYEETVRRRRKELTEAFFATGIDQSMAENIQRAVDALINAHLEAHIEFFHSAKRRA